MRGNENSDAIEAATAARYPVPRQMPVYVSNKPMVTGRKRTPVWDVVAAFFVVVALVLVAWLAIVMFMHARPGDRLWGLHMLAFWLITTYLAIPRIHQLFTLWYVPDYFIGRTRTGDGILGDPVNLAFDGTADEIHASMQAAGWTLADEITLRSAWGIIISSVFRRSYPAAPVSNLYLFRRKHAFAYQMEVAGNAAQRHHVRFWPTPEGWYLPGGEHVDFLAAGTYDRAVGLSLFTGQITHKIDADTDAERDFIINTLRFADAKTRVRVIDKFSTAYHSRNGGGDAIQTDGALPIVNVSGATDRNPPAVMPTADKSVARHHIPPRPLLATGTLTLLGLITSIFVASVDFAAYFPLLAAYLVEATLWVLTAARFRWAWVGLMTSSSLTAISHLLVLDYTSLDDLVITAISVLVVLAVSASSVREWVRR
ncbi:MAG: LssY C-terminal domain-containing protein [Propionibacteriaceae bacterium]|nr:LssY C-terminal domain-containing protein [Propionibacteriaceae bacterium]